MEIPEEEKTKQDSQSNLKEKFYTEGNFNSKKAQKIFTIPTVFPRKKYFKYKEVPKYVSNIS